MQISYQKVVFYLVILLFANSVEAKEYDLRSPDGSILIHISIEENITYSLYVNDKQILENSSLALTIDDNMVLGHNPFVIKEEFRSEDAFLFPVLKVKSERIRDHFNELTVFFKDNYKITFRAYDTGIAYRFETQFKKELKVYSELAKFNFSSNDTVYFPREKEFHSHNERLYELTNLDSLEKKDLCSLPVLIATKNKFKLFITETGLLDYPGMWLTGVEGNALTAVFPQVALEEKIDSKRWKDDRSIRVTKTADYIAKTKGERTFPWRIIGISKKDADLITNQLTYQLAKPSESIDFSWIKPGKVIWDWWNYNNIYDVDFKAGINTETYKYYIDFAAKYGIEYVIFDEGWYELGDVMAVVPEVDLKELVRYGKNKNVGIILWTTWSSLDQKLDEALDAFQEMEIKGVKVDFMQRDDQWMVNYYQRIAEACAKRKLLVDFHGSYKPAGLRRTYPNVLTREGVKGAENNKWAAYITPDHNLTIPFIRMVAGPMDYTPGAMLNRQKENFTISWNRPMSLGTRCHQLAMYVCYESPLQMLCDSPSNYYREQKSMKFLSKVPTVWDETIVLDAKIGNRLLVARRNKNEWYIGGMTNWSSTKLQLDLSFLPKDKKYLMTLYSDGINADRVGIDFMQTEIIVDSNYNKKIQLAKGGGLAAMLIPIK
ncbi:alpha-glucosidase [Aquimarina sp. EL_43]|uniref:glycoside hydrolase family 97 protein n=1 Tax=unclassified Aquimarina TaxID=2627091 RepID=UPI0018C8E3E9|nr:MULTISPECIES: glycoside hydrolase family 97 protein [unclassified Aquimarina]MBG6133577.1 alpha-glucosidase [Aquimarina sp. EL_35]MBG6153795.1 alpha-glucosidase [Aquimarina sp. EL_32]MBG6171971.1 alpha-glucosidase [Aquimarina sp. EL_43]